MHAAVDQAVAAPEFVILTLPNFKAELNCGGAVQFVFQNYSFPSDEG